MELLSDTQKYAIVLDGRAGDLLSETTDDFDNGKVGSKRQKERVDLDQVVRLKQAMDTPARLGTGAARS